MSRIVDLRSDTVTQPSAGMRAAAASAQVGDDSYDEDAAVKELESNVAGRFRKEAAMFVTNCTLANLLAAQLLAGRGQDLISRGQELICATTAEIVAHAHGNLAAIAGISTRTCAAGDGLLDADAVAKILNLPGYPGNPTRVIAVEQTHNRVGGRAYPLDVLAGLRKLADEVEVGLLCDGARIWNAHVATGVALHEYGSMFDILTVSLTKGLGCTEGALVVGPADLIKRGKVLRKQLGGAVRKPGMTAAAGTYALEHNLLRLAEDHRRAAALATALARFGVVEPSRVHTNIVNLDLGGSLWSADGFVAAAADQGVRCFAWNTSEVRLVFHMGVTDDDLDHAVTALSRLLGQRRKTQPRRRRPAAAG